MNGQMPSPDRFPPSRQVPSPEGKGKAGQNQGSATSLLGSDSLGWPRVCNL